MPFGQSGSSSVWITCTASGRAGRRSARRPRGTARTRASASSTEPGEHGDERGDLLAVPLLRDHRQRRRGRQVDERRDVVGRVRAPTRGTAAAASRRARPGRRSGRRGRSGPTGCSSSSNCVTIPKLPPPPRSPQKQVGVLVCARADEPPVGGDDVGADEVVAGEAVLAHQPADAAAEREAADAGASRRARRSSRGRAPASRGRRRPRRRRRRRTRRRASGSTRTLAHRRRGRSRCRRRTVEKPAMLWPPPRTASGRSLLRAKPTAAITSAAPAQRTIDRRPPAVVHAVPDAARLGVAVVARREDLAAHRLAQLLDRRLAEHRGDRCAHVVPPFRLGWRGSSYRGAFARLSAALAGCEPLVDGRDAERVVARGVARARLREQRCARLEVAAQRARPPRGSASVCAIQRSRRVSPSTAAPPRAPPRPRRVGRGRARGRPCARACSRAPSGRRRAGRASQRLGELALGARRGRPATVSTRPRPASAMPDAAPVVQRRAQLERRAPAPRARRRGRPRRARGRRAGRDAASRGRRRRLEARAPPRRAARARGRGRPAPARSPPGSRARSRRRRRRRSR